MDDELYTFTEECIELEDELLKIGFHKDEESGYVTPYNFDKYKKILERMKNGATNLTKNTRPSPVIRCNHCGTNLCRTGIKEIVEQAKVLTDITFHTNQAMMGEPEFEEVGDIYCECLKCGKVIFSGDVQASEIIDFYKGKTEYIASFVSWSGGSPNPAALEKERNVNLRIEKRCWN